jgi:hypothetical protein
VVKLVGGMQAMQVVTQLLVMAVLMPVVTGAMYRAWKDMQGVRDAVPPPVLGIEA